MLNYFKRDFASVRMAIKWLTDEKAPDWAIVIWYVIWLPIMLPLAPFVILLQRWAVRKMMAEIKNLEKD